MTTTNIRWQQLKSGGYTGFDENGNQYYFTDEWRACSVLTASGKRGYGFTIKDALESTLMEENKS